MVRGGYGIGYVHFNRIGSADVLATNFPQITRANVAACAFGNEPALHRAVSPKAMFPPDAGRLSQCFAEQRRAAHSARSAYGLHPELAAFGATRTQPKYVAGRGLCRKSRRQTDFAGGFESGASEQCRRKSAARCAPPDSGFRSISAVLPAAFSNYHALQVKFERRFTKSMRAELFHLVEGD
ncbi:MAG: hypothetical protein U0X75_27135 [Acidobacteriota bacterium]